MKSLKHILTFALITPFLLTGCIESSVRQKLGNLEKARVAGTVSDSEYRTQKAHLTNRLEKLVASAEAFDAARRRTQNYQQPVGIIPSYSSTQHLNSDMQTSEITMPVQIKSSKGNPTEANAAAYVGNLVSSRSRGAVRLLSLRKVDGLQRNFAGVQSYKMECIIRVQFSRPVVWSALSDRFEEMGPPPQPGVMDFSLAMLHYQAGQIAEYPAEIDYILKESGWNGEFSLKRTRTTVR